MTNQTKNKKKNQKKKLPAFITTARGHLKDSIKSLQNLSSLLEQIAVVCTDIDIDDDDDDDDDVCDDHHQKEGVIQSPSPRKRQKRSAAAVVQFSVTTDAKVDIFKNISAAARALAEETGGNVGTLQHNIGKFLRRDKESCQGYYYRYSNDDNNDGDDEAEEGQEDSPSSSPAKQEEQEEVTPTGVVQFSVETDTIVGMFKSISAASRALAEETGGKVDTLRHNISKNLRQEKANCHGYYYRYCYNNDDDNKSNHGDDDDHDDDNDDDSDGDDDAKDDTSSSAGQEITGVVQFSVVTEAQVATFDSISAAARALAEEMEGNFNTMRYYIGKILKGEKENYHGYYYRYCYGSDNSNDEDDDEEEKEPSSPMRPKVTGVVQFSVVTDAKVAVFKSISAAARALAEEMGGKAGTIRQTVRNILHGDKENYHGYYYRYCHDKSSDDDNDNNDDDDDDDKQDPSSLPRKEAKSPLKTRGKISVVKCHFGDAGTNKDDDNGNDNVASVNEETTKELARFESITAAAQELIESNPPLREKSLDWIRQSIGQVARGERDSFSGFTYRYATTCHNEQPSRGATNPASPKTDTTSKGLASPLRGSSKAESNCSGGSGGGRARVVVQLCAKTKQEVARFTTAAAAARELSKTHDSITQDTLRKRIGHILQSSENESYHGFLYCYSDKLSNSSTRSPSKAKSKKRAAHEEPKKSKGSPKKRKASSLSVQRSPRKNKKAAEDTTTASPAGATTSAEGDETAPRSIPPDLYDVICLGATAHHSDIPTSLPTSNGDNDNDDDNDDDKKGLSSPSSSAPLTETATTSANIPPDTGTTDTTPPSSSTEQKVDSQEDTSPSSSTLTPWAETTTTTTTTMKKPPDTTTTITTTAATEEKLGV